jgi:hypothetical protein
MSIGLLLGAPTTAARSLEHDTIAGGNLTAVDAFSSHRDRLC